MPGPGRQHLQRSAPPGNDARLPGPRHTQPKQTALGVCPGDRDGRSFVEPGLLSHICTYGAQSLASLEQRYMRVVREPQSAHQVRAPSPAPDIEQPRVGCQGGLGVKIASELVRQPVCQGQDGCDSSIGFGPLSPEPPQLGRSEQEGGRMSRRPVDEIAVSIVDRGSLHHGAQVEVRAGIDLPPVPVEECDSLALAGHGDGGHPVLRAGGGPHRAAQQSAYVPPDRGGVQLARQRARRGVLDVGPVGGPLGQQTPVPAEQEAPDQAGPGVDYGDVLLSHEPPTPRG